ncbi:phosphoribosylformylglycinamidine cyclo-ligase [Candidatus Uhrbacteria bacterium]|nr:phosphoribosylformylglycinamidine cyclo-ligase [Candidatus Uhrbacteria bacterium]
MTQPLDGGMTYASVGIDYEMMDPFKRMAQAAAQETSLNIRSSGYAFEEETRGESVQLVEMDRLYLAHVEEGLGTKNIIADEMYRLNGRSYYGQIAEDTVAMIVNDMITLGAMPLTVAMHLAVGSSDWFNNVNRARDLIHGWQRACNYAGCTWGGGETPTLKDVVIPGRFVLNGSATGIIEPKKRRIWGNIQNGDRIILLNSSGVHANGLTLARKIAEKLPEGYLTKLSSGKTYGEALLDSTQIYVHVIEDLLDAGVDIHYAVNITGHGWRKLMRSPRPFTYVIKHLPTPMPIFEFLQEKGSISDEEMYGTFNMGAGFALYLDDANTKKAVHILDKYPFPKRVGWIVAGSIHASEERMVVIESKDIVFDEASLNVRS